MKNTGIAFACIVLFISNIYGQYQAANWPILYNNLMVKITEDTFERDSLAYGTTGFIANTSVSDVQGNLLFYSLGVDARNNEGTVMDSGCCLCQDTTDPNNCIALADGNPHMQGALILPRPGSSTQYYLFIKDESVFVPDEQPARITATLVDLSYNNGLGKVLQRAVPILNTPLSDSRMTACQHGNGRDWWLVNHQYNSNLIYTHLITSDTIEGPFEQSIGLAGIENDNTGWSIFSPGSNTFATTTGGMGSITLLDFDRCTGVFSNFRVINTTNGDTGNYYFLAFSPSGRFLYAGNNNYIMQYDLQSADSPITGVEVVHDTAEIPLLGMMVLMPDWKIYIAGWTVSDSLLSVIDSPDLKYPDCAFHLRSVLVPHSGYIHNAPNFPNYNLGPVIGSACDTITGIQEPGTRNQELKIMPNPADGCVVISYSAAAAADEPPILTICNPLGQTVYTQTLPMYSGLQKIEVSNWAGGIYMVFIKRSGAVIATGKFVKQ